MSAPPFQRDPAVGAHPGGAATPAPSAHAPARAPSTPREVALRRYWTLNASHAAIDVFPIFTTSLMLVLQGNLSLNAAQVTTLYALTPIFSGGLQPLFAWLTDRYDTRLCAPVGLMLGAACLSSVGFATAFWQLVILVILGVIGTGMYHPIGAALAGQIGGRALTRGRGWAVSLFIACGMIGQSIGPILSTRMTNAYGMRSLLWLVLPAGVVAFALLLLMRRVGHRHDNHAELHAALTPDEARQRIRAVALLTTSNCLRFTTNIGMLVMFNAWAASKIADPKAAASLNGNLATAMTIGMGIFGLLGGRLIAQGREKRPMVLVSVVGAFCVASVGFAGDWGWAASQGAWWGLLPAYALASLTAFGFFTCVPVSVGLAQRLLPSHTGLASSLTMGVGWAASASAPFLAPLFMGESLQRAQTFGGVTSAQLNAGFIGFGALLLAAAALSAALPSRALQRVANHH